jgi:deoxyribodipyrimidine photo-lyase
LNYAGGRDRPDQENTSRLSPHLHFGDIGPGQVWHALTIARQDHEAARNVDKFFAEIGWREFSYHLLYHRPTLPEQNFRPAFDRFPWERNDHGFKT